MNEPVAEHMDGRVLSEVFVPDVASAMAQRRATRSQNGNESGSSGASAGGEVLSAEDKKLLAERLRNLGYVG